MFSVSEYYSLPKLHSFDSYDECMADSRDYNETYYCVADVVVKPNPDSDLWQIIEVIKI